MGRLDWLLHRVVASYWSLPVLAVLAAPFFAVGLLLLDRAELTAVLLDADLAPVATSDTAKDLVAVAVGVNAALLTLYFSITLLVLTVASSNLGVRLVDRWLDKRLVRVSLSGLSFTLIFSLVALAAIDAEADLADTPLATVAAVIALQAINVAMLTVALHDLGRTIFVDRAIHHLGREAASGPAPIETAEPYAGEWAATVDAPREGYVEGNDLDLLRKRLDGHSGAVRVCAAPGQHVLEGEPLILLQNAVPDDSRLGDAIAIGDFRSDGQGAVFQVRLLVEIAARALSPAVNDFYTAMASCDRLAAAMTGQAGKWVDEGRTAVYAEDHRFELPGQDFRGLFEDPLNALRQAACEYPSVSIRMIDNYRRLIEENVRKSGPAQLRAFWTTKAQELAEHAEARAQYDCDRADITEAFRRIAEPEGKRRAAAA